MPLLFHSISVELPCGLIVSFAVVDYAIDVVHAFALETANPIRPTGKLQAIKLLHNFPRSPLNLSDSKRLVEFVTVNYDELVAFVQCYRAKYQFPNNE